MAQDEAEYLMQKLNIENQNHILKFKILLFKLSFCILNFDI